MNHYELSFLTPDLTGDEKNSLLKEIENQITKLGGKIEDKFIEKKRFAYPIKKKTEGFLGIFFFSLEKENIIEIKKNIEKNNKILRIILEKKKMKITKERRTRPEETTPQIKKEKKKKVKIEDLDKKLEEILK
ncbi:MAG: 30S ribosomal protein S6 [Candidatus Pacebacteria bacterium]|nr:30S ribosomal protein S6 [Candidatus Paceibacterota bacterium]